ncbi:MAG: CdaR family transcriptional regulator [Bilifractor sp.]|jgi:carbohydrate diacid regulator
MAQKITQDTAEQIVNTVRDVSGCHINFIDPDGTIVASTDKSRIGQYHEIGRRAAVTDETIEVTEDDSFPGTQSGVNIPIVWKDEILAVIGISGNPDEVRKYAYLAQRITLLLLREQEISSRNSDRNTRINYIIRSLIHPKKMPDPIVRQYLSEMKIEPEDLCRLILIHLDGRFNPMNLSLIEKEIQQAILASGSSMYTFNYPGEYIVLLKEKTAGNFRKIFQKLAEKNGTILRIAISDVHRIRDLSRSYEEAQTAAACDLPDNPVEYSGLGLEMLCASAEKNTAHLFAEKYLSALSEEDLNLLRIYYRSEMSLVRTADALFLHKNTVQYRLDQIRKKSGYNPRQFTDAAGFYAALLLRQ